MPDLSTALTKTSTGSTLAADIPSALGELNGPLSLEALRKLLDEARYNTNDARLDSLTSRRYYDGYQLSAADLTALNQRKQPPVVINRMQRAIDGIMGVVQKGKSDPRALMRNPPEDTPQQPAPDLDAGDIASMTLRFIADTSDFETTDIDVLENGLIEGCGAAITEVDGDNVTVTQIRWEEFFYDPFSRRPDFKDARYMGIAKWMYADDLAILYPQAKTVMGDFSSSGLLYGFANQTWEDRPQYATPWVDGKKRRVMVAELYHQQGGIWYRAVLYCAQILAYDKSPYQDDKKNPICPIEGWSAYVDGQNQRYGIAKPMRPIQDEINMRRSKALHEINSRQIQQVDLDAPPVDVDNARLEASRPDGVLPTGYQVVPRQDVIANNTNMMAEAKGELDRMAPTPALIGRNAGPDASGRAQQISQEAGLTELSRVLGRHHLWKQRMYTQMWNRARQFWQGPKWIRVTGEEDAPKYVQVNVPGPPVPQQDPQTGQVVMVPAPGTNHIAEMQVDIVLEDVPDTATLQQEQFNEFMAFAQANPGSIPPEMLIELSAIPEKWKFIKKLKAYQQAGAAQKQQAEQVQMAGAQAEVQLKQANAQKAQAAAGQHSSSAAADQASIAETQADIALKQAQTALLEVQTVIAALEGHLTATKAAQLPQGVVLDGSGTPALVEPAPHPSPKAEVPFGQ